ncbi:hydrogenase nickel incorporation protein HypB [Lapillicoccus sp.]|uniref:hydrogenase nickel incorporation protein HypB n=1 Tax=Lapillicoccus sp. TaxID=1909287 RepID=UPI003265B032
MGRFHRHDDGTAHEHSVTERGGHEHDSPSHADASPEHDLGDMSGYGTGPERIQVLERIFGENDRTAQANRDLLDANRVVAINMMSSPGAGKTLILQRTLAAMADRADRADKVRVGIVEGDIETSIDADRLAGYGAQIALLNTSNGFGGECHLDAPMVRSALARLTLAEVDLLFVENVGNLVCPAEFDVGAHHRVMVFAITEGEEKPLKYPVMFRSVELLLLNKMDLLPHLDFDMALFERNLRSVNPTVTVIPVSARTGEGLDNWYAWLKQPTALPTNGAASST